MFATLAAKLIPYKTIIIIGIIVIALGAGWLHVHNIKSDNIQLRQDNVILINNNIVLNTEKQKWIDAMSEQVELTKQLELGNIAAVRETAELKTKLSKIKISFRNLNKKPVVKFVENPKTGLPDEVAPTTASELTVEILEQYRNSYGCISNATGSGVKCDE